MSIGNGGGYALETEDLIRVLIDPFYTINVDPALVAEHHPIVSKAQWVRANSRLIDELGAEEWLVYLLSILEGDLPRTSDDAALLSGDSGE
jgi:hypothetical protein